MHSVLPPVPRIPTGYLYVDFTTSVGMVPLTQIDGLYDEARALESKAGTTPRGHASGWSTVGALPDAFMKRLFLHALLTPYVICRAWLKDVKGQTAPRDPTMDLTWGRLGP